ANITASGGNGNISLYAGDSVLIATGVTISVVQSGSILVSASTDYNAGTPQDGYNSPDAASGIIDMNGTAAISSVSGSITLQGDGSIAVTTISSSSGNVNVTANYTGPGNTLGDAFGAVTDATPSADGGTANISTGGTLTLSAASGIGATGDADLDITVATLSATNTSSGDIFIAETNGLSVTGATTSGGNGNIDIRTATGSFTVSGAVTANGSGDVTIIATGGLLTIDATINSSTGDISLTGGTGVTHNASGDITTTGIGTITVAATTGNISMADGTVYATGSGTVSITAATSIVLAEITATSSA
ncbi:MAG: hypothetical protein ACKPHU_30560, partial [Planctomycetaceae bacterium]